MLTRREVAAGVALGAAALAAKRPVNAEALSSSAAVPLAEAARRSGRLYGCAASTFELRNPAFVSVLRRESAILVAEYEMKRNALEPQPDRIDFAAADSLLRFAHAHGMAFRGHTLVWHKANPAWLQDELSATGRDRQLSGYIGRVMGHYRGRMHSWDVVNEAIDPESGRADNLRDTPWLRSFGPSYLAEAFHAARAADPAALLVYNDWGCEGAGEKHDRFRAATLSFLEDALARKVPIDAYGMQGHLQAFGPPVDQRKLRDFLGQLRSLGLRVLVTEHDVDDSGGPLDVAMRDRAVADASRRFLDVALDSPATIGVLTWGLSDRFLDPPGWKARLAGYNPRLLPLDDSFARKPMWSAMAASFATARQVSDGTNPADVPPLRLHKLANP